MEGASVTEYVLDHSRSELSEPALLICQGSRTYLQRIATKSPLHYDIVNISASVGKKIYHVYHEWVVVKDGCSRNCCLLNLVSQERIQLPEVSFKYTLFGLSSHPTDPACHLVLYDKSAKAFKFCRPGDGKFVRKKARECRVPNATGEIYFSSCHRDIGDITCVEFDDSSSCVTPLKLDMGPHTKPIARGAWCYVAGYCGELFLVRRYYHYNFNSNATGFCVFKADFSKKRWVEVKSIAPLTILLDDELNGGMCHMCRPGHDSGIMSNAIYFFEKKQDTTYYAYSLEDESITMYPTDCPPNASTSSRSWLVFPHNTPSSLHRDHIEEKEVVGRQDLEGTLEECESLTEDEVESWASLPKELLSGILSNLFARDYAVFHGVCKSWQQITTQLSVHPTSSIFRQEESNVPLLMFVENRDVPVYKLFDHIHRKYQRLEIPELKGADIRYSKHGWLLASRRSEEKESLFFLNPLTREKIELPNRPVEDKGTNLYFSSPPTSSDCLIVSTIGCLTDVFFMTLRRGESTWRVGMDEDEPHKSLLPCSSPVVHNGLHYYACEDRRMVAFDFYADDIKLVNSWSTRLQAEAKKRCRCCCTDEDECFLLEIDGVPALVTVPRDTKKKINLYKWNVLKNDWVRMEDTDLGNNDMFLSRRSSFLKKVDYGGGMGNKIFLSLVDKDAMDGVFYSLKTQKYHTFYSGYSRESYYCAAKFHDGIWVEPLHTKSSEDNLTWCSDVESEEGSGEERDEESDEGEEEGEEEREEESAVETYENI